VKNSILNERGEASAASSTSIEAKAPSSKTQKKSARAACMFGDFGVWQEQCSAQVKAISNTWQCRKYVGCRNKFKKSEIFKFMKFFKDLMKFMRSEISDFMKIQIFSCLLLGLRSLAVVDDDVLSHSTFTRWRSALSRYSWRCSCASVG
jgi:hypothetical protein